MYIQFMKEQYPLAQQGRYMLEWMFGYLKLIISTSQ